MSILDSPPAVLATVIEDPLFDEAEVAAAFLARYNGRTLDAYRYDLRTFFQWASDAHLAVLDAKRPHIELYRTSMEEKGLAPSTIDRRLSTVCGFYRFAHIDGRVAANPAQYVRRPTVHPSEGRGLDRLEFGTFLFTAERFDQDHAALAVLLGLNGLRVSEACGTNIEDIAFDRGHRTLRILGKGSKPAVIPLVPRAARTIAWSSGSGQKAPSSVVGMGCARIGARPIAGSLDRQEGWARRRLSPHAPGSVHHGGLGCRSPAPGRPDRCPPRRSKDDDRLRPQAGDLRPPCRLCRGGVRSRRIGRHVSGRSRGTPRRPAIERATSPTDRSVRSAATRT
jgi:integrase/recombinase XerD